MSCQSICHDEKCSSASCIVLLKPDAFTPRRSGQLESILRGRVTRPDGSSREHIKRINQRSAAMTTIRNKRSRIKVTKVGVLLLLVRNISGLQANHTRHPVQTVVVARSSRRNGCDPQSLKVVEAVIKAHHFQVGHAGTVILSRQFRRRSDLLHLATRAKQGGIKCGFVL